MLADPSHPYAGCPHAVMSATICPGMTNSASSSPSHMPSITEVESGPVMRKQRWWRSPTNVSDCQSIERTSVSKILSRAGREARPTLLQTWRSDSLNGLQVRPNARDRRWPRVAPVPQIKDKSRIAYCISAKSGRSDVALTKELLYLSQQMHRSILTRRKNDPATRPFPTHFLLV